MRSLFVHMFTEQLPDISKSLVKWRYIDYLRRGLDCVFFQHETSAQPAGTDVRLLETIKAYLFKQIRLGFPSFENTLLNVTTKR